RFSDNDRAGPGYFGLGVAAGSPSRMLGSGAVGRVEPKNRVNIASRSDRLNGTKVRRASSPTGGDGLSSAPARLFSSGFARPAGGVFSRGIEGASAVVLSGWLPGPSCAGGGG